MFDINYKLIYSIYYFNGSGYYVGRIRHRSASTPSYVYERESASALGAPVFEAGLVLLGSLALDGFGIDHIVQGASSIGVKELVGGVVSGALSVAFGSYALREQKDSFRHAQQLEAELKNQG